jgi:hypothetical protein
LAAAVASAGCGGSSSSTIKSGPKPLSSAAAGWKVYAPKGGGYRVEIHTGWVTIDAVSLASSSAMRALEAKNPTLAGAFKALAPMARQPGVLVAFDRTPAAQAVTRRTGFTPNIIVRRIPLDPSKSDDALLRAVLSVARTSAAGIPTAIGRPSVSRLTIAGLPAGVVTYRLRENTFVGTAQVTESDYVTVRNGIAYTFYCSTVPLDVPRLHTDCAHAMQSFAFTG